MSNKGVRKLTLQDLQELKNNKVIENKTLEYKEILHCGTDSERKEFLADVSSFANASGGNIIFGVISDKKSGAPQEIQGFALENADKEILKLQSIIRDSIDRRIQEIDIYPINLPNGNTVLIIGINKSLVGPHMVIFKGTNKFYSRDVNGKYPMNVSELQNAFRFSSNNINRIREFRKQRIKEISSNNAAIPLDEGAKICLHLVPIYSLDSPETKDIKSVISSEIGLQAIYSLDNEYKYSVDGIIAFPKYSLANGKRSYSYAKLYNNSVIEAVDCSILEPYNGKNKITTFVFQKELINSLLRYLKNLESLEAELPIFFLLSLVGIKGYSIYVDRMNPKMRLLSLKANPINEDILYIPEIPIYNYHIDAKVALKPCFDAVWNACGYPHSIDI